MVMVMGVVVVMVIVMVITRLVTMHCNDTYLEASLHCSSQHHGATPPESSVDMKWIVLVEVEQLHCAVLLQGPVHVPQLVIDQGKSRPAGWTVS